jgi:FdhD protein
MRTYLHVRGERVEEVAAEVVREQPLSVFVNGEKFLTLLCSPMMLEALVVGYLWMEKVIAEVSEVTGLTVSPVDGRAEVTLSHAVTLPTERILTSGCGGGITFRIDHRLFPPLRSSLRVEPGELAARMKDLFAAATHYRRSRGIHGAALAERERLLLVAEDVGRHNAVDKIKGEALLRGVPTEDRLLLSTGRISSEMLLKAARMGVPVVASRTSPTEMAVALAEQLGITVCGYVRPDSLNVYAGDGVVLATAGGPPAGGGADSPETRAYRRGFRQKSKRDDYALDLFQEARASLRDDTGRVDRVLRELSRLYNPLADGPIVDLATRARIMGLLGQGRPAEAQALLDERYRMYAPVDDATRQGPSGPGT